MGDVSELVVIIPAYNAEAFLERAVRSVWATEFPAIAAVIVDDGSSDATAKIAERLCAERPGHCRLLRHPGGTNLGVSASRNLGIRESTSEWIAFLDADDFYLPNRFSAWRRLATESKAVEAVYELSEVRSDAGAPGAGNWWSSQGDTLFGIRRPLVGSALLAELLQGQCWAISAITLRRNLLFQVGMFDVGKRIAEDCNLWFRLAAVGRIVAGDLAQPVSVYWRHASNTYQYQLSHRIAMITAMLDAWHWARRRHLADEVLATFRDCAYAYATRSIVAAREASDPAMAMRIFHAMARPGSLSYFWSFEALRQGLAASRELAIARAR